MDKVIGLGKTGCAIAEEFTTYPEYRVYKIASEIEERGSLSLGVHGDMEQYEKQVDQDEVAIYLRSIKASDEVLFIVEGADPIVGSALRVLETIKDAKISILYICPDRQMSSNTQRRDDRISFNVLQEYARSGAIERIFLLDKPTVERLVGDVPIEQYEKSLSYFISYTIAMVNYFNHTDSILEQTISPANISRLTTVGVSSLEDGSRDAILLFPLEDITDLHFFYGIPEIDLAEDSSLIGRIKSHAKSHKTEGVSTSFSVHKTTLDKTIVLCVAYSNKIQNFVTQ